MKIILYSILRANRHADCRQTVQRDLGVGDEADQVYFAEFGRIVGHRKGSLSRADSKPKDVATNNRGYLGSGEGNWTGITWVSFFNGNLSLYWQFVKILSLSDPPATISSSLWAIKEFCCSQIVTQMKRSIAKDEGQDNSCIQIITEDHGDYFMRWRTTVENCLPKIS